MQHSTRFAYAQARLQSRHGKRPGDQVWQQLASIGDLAGYLSMARRTSLSQWVMGMNTLQNIHYIELSLRKQFREYIDEVAVWLPEQWHEPVKWTRRLPDLPALLHLLRGNTAPHWMLEDPALKELASEQKDLRMEAFMESDCSSMVELWQTGLPLHIAWLEHWKKLVPPGAESDKGIIKLAHLYQASCTSPAGSGSMTAVQQRQMLEERFTSLFRLYSFQATAAFAHLGLVALDIAKLRQEISQRMLFPEILMAAS